MKNFLETLTDPKGEFYYDSITSSSYENPFHDRIFKLQSKDGTVIMSKAQALQFYNDVVKPACIADGMVFAPLVKSVFGYLPVGTEIGMGSACISAMEHGKRKSLIDNSKDIHEPDIQRFLTGDLEGYNAFKRKEWEERDSLIEQLNPEKLKACLEQVPIKRKSEVSIDKPVPNCRPEHEKYVIKCLSLEGQFRYDHLTKEDVETLKAQATRPEYHGRNAILNWFKDNKLKFWQDTMRTSDPNGLVYDLIDILKDWEF